MSSNINRLKTVSISKNAVRPGWPEISFYFKSNRIFRKVWKFRNFGDEACSTEFFFRGQELCFYLRFATNPSLNHAPVACLNIFQAWAPVIGGLRDWSDTNWQPPSWDCEKCDAIGKRRPFTFFKINTCLLRKNTSKKLYAWTIPLYCFQLTKWAKAEK